MKKIQQYLLMLVLIAGMIFSLSACGDAKAKEEYKAAYQQLLSDMEYAGEMDLDDVDTAIDVLQDIRYNMTQFIAIDPPSACKEGHEKLASGCQAMINYIDTAFEYVDMIESGYGDSVWERYANFNEAENFGEYSSGLGSIFNRDQEKQELEDAENRMSTYLQTAFTDMSEGIAILDEVYS